MRKMFIFVCLGILMCGCAQHRRWASPEVADVDAGSIVTRNKYRIRSFCTGQKLPLSKTYVSRTAIEAELSRHYPEVFAPDGIPVDVAEGESLDYSNYGVITVLLPFLCSGTTLPLVNLQEWWKLYTITVGDSEFDFKTHAGELEYLKGKKIEVTEG